MGGWLGAIGSMFSWIGGEGIGASLARIAIGLGISKLLNKTNESAASSTSSSTPQGTRQQIAAATDNKIPVAYGDSYFSGTVVDQRTINDNKETIVVLDLCEITGDIFSTSPGNPAGRAASDIIIDAIYLNNQIVTFKADGTTIDYTTDDTGVVDTNAQGLCGIYLYKGSSNGPMLPCINGTRTPIAGTVPPVAYQIMPGWDASYTNQNKIFALVKMNYDPSKGLSALPTFKFHVRNTMNKVGDCLHDYSTNVMYGAGLPESLIDNASIIALNTYGDESVTLGAYPAQPRYRVNGLVRTTENVLSNMEKLAAAGGSVISYDIGTGKFSVVVNRSTAKSLDFNDSNILGQIAVFSTDLTGLYNKVEVQFPYKILKDQYNYVRFNLPEAYRNANEPDNIMQITHEFVNDPVQATILANLDLRQSREDLSVTFKTDYSKYNVAIGTVIGITNDVYGWTSKLFKVIRIKKNESDEGQLTIEITAQAYNEDVYTVEDISDFVPLIGVGHSLPSLTPIQQPAAPTITSQTLSSQPSVTITGVVPVGVVTEMEFWYTSSTLADDNARPYTQLGTMRSENGGPFTIGDVTSFKTVLLASGTYYFKVRANNNGSSTSKFSPPSVATPYTYVQAPDVLKYTTPVVAADGAVDENGTNMGLMAAYLGYKLFEKPITDYVKELFGLTDEAAAAAAASVAKDAAAAEDAIQAAIKASNAEDAAAIATQNAATASGQANAAAAKADAAAAKAEAALAATPGAANVTVYSNVAGHDFPSLFGDGPTTGPTTHAGIFTHDNLVYGRSVIAAPQFVASNVVTGTTITAEMTGTIQNFYNIPGSDTWAKPPVYTQSLTDKFAYDSTLSLYYATATYTSGNLDAQSWSSWTLLNANNGVTGIPKGSPVVTKTWTNPYDDSTAPYVIEEAYDYDGYGDIALLPATEYDPFKPNVEVTVTTYTDVNTQQKSLTITLNGNKTFSTGSADLIIFGTSPFKLPDGTPFASNTAFGHIAPVYRQSFPNALAFKEITNNGSRFVAIQNATDKVYWSDNGYEWFRIALDPDVTAADSWLKYGDKMPPFEFVTHDGSKFLAYNLMNGVATSTDGKIWTEYLVTQGISPNTTTVITTSGHYLTVGPGGIQTSSDGKTWSAVSLPSVFDSQPIYCGCWDGSKFIVGSKYNYGKGGAMLSSPDGITWTVMSTFNNPNLNQAISNYNNTKLVEGKSLVGGLVSRIFG